MNFRRHVSHSTPALFLRIRNIILISGFINLRSFYDRIGKILNRKIISILNYYSSSDSIVFLQDFSNSRLTSGIEKGRTVFLYYFLDYII